MVATYFGDLSREHFNNGRTPKLHLLKVEIPIALKKYHQLGLFAEDSIEREHHLWKRCNILFQNVKSTVKKKMQF
jgi:hypothetical protein